MFQVGWQHSRTAQCCLQGAQAPLIHKPSVVSLHPHLDLSSLLVCRRCEMPGDRSHETRRGKWEGQAQIQLLLRYVGCQKQSRGYKPHCNTILTEQPHFSSLHQQPLGLPPSPQLVLSFQGKAQVLPLRSTGGQAAMQVPTPSSLG